MATDYRFRPKDASAKLGWYDRGYLPHFDGGQIPQFLTFRLYDSLPRLMLEKLREDTLNTGEAGKSVFRRKVELFLDQGYGECFLKNERVAELVQNSLFFIIKRNTG